MVFFLTPGWAQQVKSLYRVEVPVASQEASDRAQGLRVALIDVLVRASGRSDIATVPAIESQLKSPENWVNEFGYIVPAATSDEALRLWVRFDSDGIRRLLGEAGVAVWGDERPLILSWMVSQVSQEAHVLTAEQDAALVAAFRDAARRYALPVVFPMMDLSEMTHIGTAAILRQDYPLLLEAAKRYGSRTILSGQLLSEGQGLRLTASLQLADGDHWEWDLTGKDASEVFAALADRMASILSARYATETAAEQVSETHLTINGIQGAEDMNALTEYLQHFASVTGVDVLQIEGTRIVLNLHLRGEFATFAREAGSGVRLLPVPGQPLEYQWKG